MNTSTTLVERAGEEKKKGKEKEGGGRINIKLVPKRVSFAPGVVDNELYETKSSKVCCMWEFGKPMGDSDSESDEDPDPIHIEKRKKRKEKEEMLKKMDIEKANKNC